MTPSGIVEFEIPGKAGAQTGRYLVGSQVDVHVLNAAPQSLDERVVHPPALAVHTDRDPVALEHAGERLGGELSALVGIEDMRRSKAL